MGAIDWFPASCIELCTSAGANSLASKQEKLKGEVTAPDHTDRESKPMLQGERMEEDPIAWTNHLAV